MLKSTRILKLSLLSVLTSSLVGCGDPSGDNSDNHFLALDVFTHVELVRDNTPSITINLQTGTASGLREGTLFTCLANNELRQQLYEVVRSLLVTPHNGACPTLMATKYERFYSSQSEATIDGCSYSYAGDGAQAMSDLYKAYMNFCAPDSLN